MTKLKSYNLKTTTNKSTRKIRYYIDGRRVTKEKYAYITSTAVRQDCFLTVCSDRLIYNLNVTYTATAWL